MPKLYHVSFDLSEPFYKEFTPKVPQNCINGEDENIPRICFSDSIKGCIRAITGTPKTDEGYVDIIVWEYDFGESHSLYDWKYLYVNNLVPDAAVTHEYWYTERISLCGSYYRISEMESKILYSFEPKYKESILEILSEYLTDLNIFNNVDPCTIINEWVPEYLSDYEVEIVDKMKEAVSVIEEKPEDELEKQIWGEKRSTYLHKVPDYDSTEMLISYKIEKR